MPPPSCPRRAATSLRAARPSCLRLAPPAWQPALASSPTAPTARRRPTIWQPALAATVSSARRRRGAGQCPTIWQPALAPRAFGTRRRSRVRQRCEQVPPSSWDPCHYERGRLRSWLGAAAAVGLTAAAGAAAAACSCRPQHRPRPPPPVQQRHRPLHAATPAWRPPLLSCACAGACSRCLPARVGGWGEPGGGPGPCSHS